MDEVIRAEPVDQFEGGSAALGLMLTRFELERKVTGIDHVVGVRNYDEFEIGGLEERTVEQRSGLSADDDLFLWLASL